MSKYKILFPWRQDITGFPHITVEADDFSSRGEYLKFYITNKTTDDDEPDWASGQTLVAQFNEREIVGIQVLSDTEE